MDADVRDFPDLTRRLEGPLAICGPQKVLCTSFFVGVAQRHYQRAAASRTTKPAIMRRGTRRSRGSMECARVLRADICMQAGDVPRPHFPRIGEAIALRFARDGFNLTLVDLPEKQEQLDAVVKAVEALGRRATAVFGDASLEADVVKYVEKTVQQFGGVDVMVANAGIFSYKPILELSVEEFDNVMGVNARSLMLAIKHAGRQMVKQGRGGRIIAAASWAAKTGIMNSSAYSASKFATRGLVQSAALELRQHKITVNAYAPGLIITPLTTHPDDEKNGGPASTGLKNAGLPKDMKAGTAEDVAELAAYLAKPEAWYVTGQTININGGIGMD